MQSAYAVLILSYVACRLCDIFPYYLTNSTFCGERVVGRKMCVSIFSTNMSETFLILRRIKRDVTINSHWSIIIVGF